MKWSLLLSFKECVIEKEGNIWDSGDFNVVYLWTPSVSKPSPFLWLQLSDVIGELNSLLSEQRSDNQSQEEHPSFHPQPQEKAQEEEDKVLPRVQAWWPVS